MKMKRWIGVLLCILLCVGMLPTMAFAAGDEQPVELSVSNFEEFLNAVNTVNDTNGNYIISLTDDIELTGTTPVILKNSVVTILGNGHSIINNFTGTAGLIANPGSTLNLGLPDGSDNLTFRDGDQSLNHTLSLISISKATVNMYPGVSLRDHTNKATSTTSGGGAVCIAFSPGTFNMYGGEISNCSISNNSYLNHGAGILVRSGATFNMYGGRISGNTQDSYGYGGGVVVMDSAFNMYGGEICNNSAPKYSTSYGGGSGGGVCVSGTSDFKMTGGKIYGNTAAFAGGGVYATGDSTFNMSGEEGNEIEIYENTATYGGGMYLQNSTNAEMKNVKVYKNKAITTNYYGNCGGVYIRCPLDMTNVEVYENSTEYDCGGVYVYTNTVLNMSNVEIHDNTAESYGGGVLLRAGAEFNALDNNVKVYGNTAGYGGGMLSYGSFTIDNLKIYKNTAALGGGVFAGDTFNMTGGEIYENTVDGAGGGVFMNTGAPFSMTGGKIYKNEAKELGGGVYACDSLTKTGGVIHNNTAGIGGDDIVAESSDNLTLDSVGEGLTLESTDQPITDWYHDGSRFTGELDGEGEPIYDETRWAVVDEEGNPYLYTYEKPDRAVSVALKAAHCVHTFGELIIDKAPTCSETGTGHKICSSCGDEKEEAIDASEHLWDTDYTIDKEPTCTTAGSKSIHCQNCDEVKDVQAIPTTEHTESDWIVDVEAGCVTEGSRHKKCETCGKLLKTEVIPATGHHPSEDWQSDENERWKVCTVCGEKLQRTKHTFGELIVDKAPTCTEAGRGHRICLGCGYTEYEAIKAKGHTPAENYETNDHERWKVCTVCGTVLERIPHTFGELIIDKAPTCTEEGSGHRICSGCGYKENETIKAKGHTPAKNYETNNHERWKVCTVCGTVLERIPHTFGELIVDKAPTCTETGSGHRICSGCGYVEKETIKAKGHTPAKNYETNNHERWKICTVCGTVLERIPHTFGELIVDKAPTCTEDGKGHRICSGCGYVEEEVIPATGHHPSDEWETDENERWKTCTVCGEKLQSTSHTFGKLIIDIAPTCTELGRGHRICSGCGYEESEAIKAIGHSWDSNYTVDQEPTCTTDGSKSIHCHNCDEIKDHEVISATGHAWNAGEETKAPTSIEEGEKTFICTVCGETKTEAIPQITESNVNIDTDGDGKPDLNIDTDGDGKPDLNIDTDGDGKPDLNIDTDGDGKPDLNIDTTGDGKPNLNIDTTGDGKPNLNIDTTGDGKPNLNIDTTGNGKPDLNIDTTGDGKPDTNIDTTGDGKPDTNVINPVDTGSNDMFSLVFFTSIAMFAIVLIFVICKKTKKISE